MRRSSAKQVIAPHSNMGAAAGAAVFVSLIILASAYRRPFAYTLLLVASHRAAHLRARFNRNDQRIACVPSRMDECSGELAAG